MVDHIISLIALMLTTAAAAGLLFQPAWADSGFIVNNQNNILTIFKLQTEDMPFTTGGTSFLITPNPLSHTAVTESPDYNMESGGLTLLIRDNDLLDSDPSEGIIELVGVSPGQYSIIEVAGPSGFDTNEEPAAVEITDGLTSTVEIYSVPLGPIEEEPVEPPEIDTTSLTKLQGFGAKINGIALGSGNLPNAFVSDSDESDKEPEAVLFASALDGDMDFEALLDLLGIPTYDAPDDTVFSDGAGEYVPPTFIAPDDDGAGKLVFLPRLDEVFDGLDVVMNLKDKDLGLVDSDLDMLEIPVGGAGQGVSFKLEVDDDLPSGLPLPPSGEAALFLRVNTAGNIDFGNSASFKSSPTTKFSVKKGLTGIGSLPDGCPDARTYLRNPVTNAWQVLEAPTRNPSVDNGIMCGYIQKLPHFSDYVVAGNNGAAVPPSSGGGSSGGHGGHGGSVGGGGSSGGAGHGSHNGGGGGSTIPLDSFFVAKTGRIKVGTISLVSLQGNVLAKATVGQQLQISSTITNALNQHQPYAFIVQVVDKEGFTASVSWVEGHLDPGQTLQPSRSWTPNSSGTYKVQVFVWNGIDRTPEPLADKVERDMSVKA